jgi:hypothetical protein
MTEKRRIFFTPVLKRNIFKIMINIKIYTPNGLTNENNPSEIPENIIWLVFWLFDKKTVKSNKNIDIFSVIICDELINTFGFNKKRTAPKKPNN